MPRSRAGAGPVPQAGAECLSWRWIFFVNIPLYLVTIGAITAKFRERVERREHSIDYRSATLLTAGLTLVVPQGAQACRRRGLRGRNGAAGGVRARGTSLAEPVLPLWVFRRRLLVASGTVSACAGAVLT
ncbi:hypothetical protein GCM10022222_09560 [Amycolatopsis ultiminotia]|uniref:MFS transporter n=1 Tax=Amycolatopsis ultiminotia TaxID=543629 RepID=A0ABP6V7N3_9PSEU